VIGTGAVHAWDGGAETCSTPSAVIVIGAVNPEPSWPDSGMCSTPSGVTLGAEVTGQHELGELLHLPRLTRFDLGAWEVGVRYEFTNLTHGGINGRTIHGWRAR
jgi:hypothetical protein